MEFLTRAPVVVSIVVSHSALVVVNGVDNLL